MTIKKVLLVSLLCISPKHVWGFGDGAPAGVCSHMRPGHDVEPQSSPSPYRLTATPSASGSQVQVTLRGDSGFKGFLINARLASDTKKIVDGLFTPDKSLAKGVDCNGPSSGVTHNSPDEKTSVSSTWIPPPGFKDKVVFTATVVKEFSTFWQNVQSPAVQVEGNGNAAARVSIPSSLYNACGRTEGCFGVPLGCIAARNCRLILSHKKETGIGYLFTMTTTVGSDKYVAAGLSEDSLMGDDSVVECVDNGGHLEVRESYNLPAPSKKNIVLQTNSIEIVKQESINGIHTCQWKRRFVTSAQGKTFDLHNSKYFVLLAYGDVTADGAKRRHDVAVASSKQVELAALSVEQGENLHLWVQCHGTLMIVAWLFTASLGMMLARHFKNVWEDKMPCGVKMWFACHRTFMILTLIFSIAGVAIMFYRFGLWSSSAGYHPLFGVICVGLCIMQPIIALFRCHPDNKNRPIFNWVHWFVGNAAQIVGVVAIFLAVDLSKARLSSAYWFIWLIVAFVVFHVLSHIILQIHAFTADKKVANVPDIRLQHMGASNHSLGNGQASQMVETKDAPGSEFRRFMLGVYIVGLMFIVGFMLASIWLTE